MPNPSITKADTIDAAWTQIAPAVVFGGVVRDIAYEVALQNAKDSSAVVAQKNAELAVVMADRDEKLAILDSQSKLVTAAVKGAHEYGPDSALYGAMGFVTTSSRQSGNGSGPSQTKLAAEAAAAKALAAKTKADAAAVNAAATLAAANARNAGTP